MLKCAQVQKISFSKNNLRKKCKTLSVYKLCTNQKMCNIISYISGSVHISSKLKVKKSSFVVTSDDWRTETDFVHYDFNRAYSKVLSLLPPTSWLRFHIPAASHVDVKWLVFILTSLHYLLSLGEGRNRVLPRSKHVHASSPVPVTAWFV